MGGGGTRVQSNTQSAPPQPTVLPQLGPYTQSLGDYANQLLNMQGTTPTRFANDQPIPVPGFSPLQQSGLNFIQQRSMPGGMPIPVAEMANENNLLNLPGQVGTPINLSQYTLGGLGTAGLIPQAAAPTGLEQSAASNLGNFAGQGGFDQTSPAIQQALQNLQTNITPQIQNQLATQGLAGSPELDRQLSQAYAGQLVPLYMQGLQQSQQAAMEQANIGGTEAQRMMGGLQALAGAQTGVGQQQQQLSTDALSRLMYSTLTGAPQLQQIGLRQEQRPVDQIQQALQGGDLQRQLALQQQQAVLDSYMRAREMSLGLMNPLGSFGAVSYTPSTTTTQTTKPQGFGLSKS